MPGCLECLLDGKEVCGYSRYVGECAGGAGGGGQIWSLLGTRCGALNVTLRPVACALCDMKSSGDFEQEEWHCHSSCYIEN